VQEPGVASRVVSDGAYRVATHLRKFMPLYVFGTIWVLMAMAFPNLGDDEAGGGTGADDEVAAIGLGPDVTAEPDGAEATTDTTVDPGAEAQAIADPAAAAATTTGGTGGGAARPSGGGTSPGGAGGGGGQVAAPVQGQGRTRGGVDCAPGVRQIPGSSYAAPCVAAFEGDNGGATSRGVTGDKILVVRRKAPESANSQAVAAISEGAGFADSETVEAVRKVFIDYFNKSYELYGRQVEFRIFDSTGDSTAEAQGKGIEAACNDATAIVQEVKAFAVGIEGGTVPFAQCAGERQLVTFGAAAYYPETFYKKYHPYLWHTITECERISNQIAEYIGKRLKDRPAKWAGDPALQTRTRKFATYVPDNDGYQTCVKRTEAKVKADYGLDPGPRYNYQLDVSRFPDQAAQAAVQFRSAGVTTVLLACDPISVIFLTQAAQNQNFKPEWLLLGVALQDTDNFGRSYDQDQVAGHMFGLSQLGATQKVLGPNSEPGRVFKMITGQTIPPGTDGGYFGLVALFNMLQAAGPVLTPQNMAEGAKALPPGGGPDYPAGYWSLAEGPDGEPGVGDHTMIDDSREVYWNATGTSRADGKKGTFVEVDGGKRYRNGEWPSTEPAVYPG
jgi:hypothetical protein